MSCTTAEECYVILIPVNVLVLTFYFFLLFAGAHARHHFQHQEVRPVCTIPVQGAFIVCTNWPDAKSVGLRITWCPSRQETIGGGSLRLDILVNNFFNKWCCGNFQSNSCLGDHSLVEIWTTWDEGVCLRGAMKWHFLDILNMANMGIHGNALKNLLRVLEIDSEGNILWEPYSGICIDEVFVGFPGFATCYSTIHWTAVWDCAELHILLFITLPDIQTTLTMALSQW